MSTSPASAATSQNPRTMETPTKNKLTEAFDRALPHDLDAERALLGSMLQLKEAIGEGIIALGDAGPEAFMRDAHGKLFEVMRDLYYSDQPVDGLVIKNELERRGLFEGLGGYDFLSSLVAAVPHALRANHYAKIVRDKFLLRQLIGAAHRVMKLAFDDDRPAETTLDLAEDEVFGVTGRRVTAQARPLRELADELLDHLRKRKEGELLGEPTGFFELDDLTCGLQPGELIIVAGRPSMGKTAFGLCIAEHLSIELSRPCIFFSLEMSCQQVAQRIISSRARVNAHKLRSGRHSRDDLQRLEQAADELRGAELFVDDAASMSIGQLRARAKTLYHRHKVRAVFVDYLQLLRDERAKSREQEVARISSGLKALAKELHVPVVAMAQLNRNPESQQRRGNRPRMSDLRESGAIEQDADVVMLLHREAYYKSRTEDPDGASDNIAEIIVAKQRNGPTDDVKLLFNRDYTRFDNCAHSVGSPFDPGDAYSASRPPF